MAAKNKGTGAISQKYTYPDNFMKLCVNIEKQFYKPDPEVVINDQIVVIPNFFSKELCQEMINSFENNLRMETTPMRKSKEYAVRVNDRYSSIDFDASQKLWEYLQLFLVKENQYDDFDMKALKSNFSNAIGLNPQLRVYRYRKGHHFGQHYDESVTCQLDEKAKVKGKTGWTLLIYLTGDEEFTGGGTIFYENNGKPLNIHPSKGMALLHKHGNDCMRHEGEMVKAGEKWVLRSDVVYPN